MRTQISQVVSGFVTVRIKTLSATLPASLVALMAATTLAGAQVQSLVDGNTAFALNLYSQLAVHNSTNLFFSPYSISTFLAMLYAGANGHTAAQMSQVLGFGTNQQQLASAFGQLQADLESDQQTNGIELNIANALWTQIGFPFLPAFLATATNQYQANINQADFVTNADAATQAINDWVAQETDNRIQNIVPPGFITPNTRLVLANAIYFLGAWTYQFELTNTVVQPFYLSSASQVMAPLMHMPVLGQPFNYLAGTNFQALELPYASNQLSMLILLPSQLDGLGQLEQQLSPTFLLNVLAQMSTTLLEVYLPRFTNESFFNLNNTLVQMGMGDAFTPGTADFSAIDGMRDLYVTFALHRAWGEVGEAGTQAAAATSGGGAQGGGFGPQPVFRADHPFLFFIRDTQTGSLLFVGRLANPTQSAGTPVPVPRLAMTQSGSGLTVSWPYASAHWTLQQNPDLATTDWTPVPVFSFPVGATIANDGTNNFFTVGPPPGNLFFRLVKQ